jgi:hypothetical protein
MHGQQNIIKKYIQILSPGVKNSNGFSKHVDSFAHQISSRIAIRRTLFTRNGKLGGVFIDYENDLRYQQYPKGTSNILNWNKHKLRIMHLGGIYSHTEH